MNAPPDLQRRLSAFLDDEMSLRAPDQVVSDTLAAVGRTRRRPAWRIPERWLPMTVTMRLAVVPRAMIYLIVLALLLAMLAAGGMIVGSVRHAAVSLPPPTGLAKNGLIAFDSGGHIWLATPDGRERRQLTFGPAIDFDPMWSPDGRSIAYLSASAGPLGSADAPVDLAAFMRTFGSRTVELMLIDEDGANGRRLAGDLHIDDVGGMPVWSADGHWIALSLAERGTSTIGAIELRNPGMVIPVASHARYATWSPDGQSLIFQGAVTTSEQGVYRQSLEHTPADEPERLTTSPGQGGAFAFPQWSPDGTRVLYYAGPDGVHDIWTTQVPAAAGDPVSIAAEIADEYWPVWSPDGTRIAFQRVVEGTANLDRFVLTGPEGQMPVTLDSDPVFAGLPIWAPDGTAIMGYVPDAQNILATHLIVLPVDGSPPTLIEAPRNFSYASWQRLAP